jgi:hypothetical protein
MSEEALRSLVEQAADFGEPSVTSGSIKEIAWLPSDDGIDFDNL